MAAKHRANIDINTETTGTADYWGRQRDRGAWVEKLSIRYHAYYLGGGICTLNFSIMEYSHVTNPYMYPL